MSLLNTTTRATSIFTTTNHFKCWASIIIWLLAFIGGLLPLYIVSPNDNDNSTHPRIRSILTMFAGGVFLSGSLVHLLRDAIQNQALGRMACPATTNLEVSASCEPNDLWAYLFFGGGFFLILFLEVFAHALQDTYVINDRDDVDVNNDRWSGDYHNKNQNNGSFDSDNIMNSNIHNDYDEEKIVQVSILEAKEETCLDGISCRQSTKISTKIVSNGNSIDVAEDTPLLFNTTLSTSSKQRWNTTKLLFETDDNDDNDDDNDDYGGIVPLGKYPRNTSTSTGSRISVGSTSSSVAYAHVEGLVISIKRQQQQQRMQQQQQHASNRASTSSTTTDKNPTTRTCRREPGKNTTTTATNPMTIPTTATKTDSSIVSLIIFISLSFHSVMEGVAIGSHYDAAWDILFAIVAHKAFSAFALGLELVSHEIPTKRLIVSMLTFSFMTPIGIFLGWFLLIVTTNTSTNETTTSIDENESIASGICTALSGGTFLYVAVMEIIPQELSNRQDAILKSLAILVGFLSFGILANWV